jgi:hypothetical protein
VGIQESCPQNNFRRVIGSWISEGEFCNHKINYFPEPDSQLPLHMLLAILNSKLTDWYFRLGSTNASVSHYQLYNLPTPSFQVARSRDDSKLRAFTRCIDEHDVSAAWRTIEQDLAEAPYPETVAICMVKLVEQVMTIEANRGEITRAQRSALAPEAQPLQDLLDRMIFRMAGLTDGEAKALLERLVKML